MEPYRTIGMAIEQRLACTLATGSGDTLAISRDFVTAHRATRTMASWSYDMLGGMMFVEYKKAGQGRDRLAAQPRLVWGYRVLYIRPTRHESHPDPGGKRKEYISCCRGFYFDSLGMWSRGMMFLSQSTVVAGCIFYGRKGLGFNSQLLHVF